MKHTAFLVALLLVCSDAPAFTQGEQPAPAQPLIPSFKGDQLGIDLAAFKSGHRRQTEDGKFAPFCSDDNPKGFIVEGALDVPGEVWCLLHFPFELIDRGFTPPTFAEVPTLGIEESAAIGRAGLLYRFIAIDNAQPKLWSVEAMLSRSGFEKIQVAMQTKFGLPSAQISEALQNAFGAKFEGQIASWEGQNWRVSLFEYFGSKNVTGVFYRLTEHERVYLQRKREAQEKAADDM